MPVLHLYIHGRVQGVGFRAFVTHHAQKLGLDGFVRNRSDGTVEAVVRGEKPALDALVAACREGPPASKVQRVESTEGDYDGGKGFRALPTL